MKKNTGAFFCSKESIQEIILNLKINQLKAEQSISITEISLVQAGHFLIQIASVCFNIDSLSLIKQESSTLSQTGLFFSSSATFLYVLLQIISIWLTANEDPKKSSSVLAYITWRTLHIFELLVFSLLVSCLSFSLMFEQQLRTASIFGLIALFLAIISLIFSNILVKSSVPSLSKLGMVNTQTSLLNTILLNGIIALGVASKITFLGSNIAFFFGIQIFVAFGILFRTITKPPFWSSESNKVFLTFSLALSLICIWNIFMAFLPGNEFHWIDLFITLTFLPRIADAITLFQDNVNVFQANTSSHNKLRGLLLITNLFSKSWKNDLTNCEKLQLHRFKTYMRVWADQKKMSSDEIEAVFGNRSLFSQTIARVSEDFPKSAAMAKFELLIRLMIPSENIMKGYAALKRLKKLLKENLMECSDYKLYDFILRSRLEILYLIDNIKDRSKQESNIETMFITCLSTQKGDEKSRDVDHNLPLENKTLFLKLNEAVKTALNRKDEIYKYFTNKLNSNTSLMSIDLYHLNQKAKASVDYVVQILNEEIKYHKLLPSYFYPLIFLFNGLVVNNSLKAKKAMRAFKKSLFTWELVKARVEASKVESIYLYTVTLQVCLQNTNRGTITDASPGWEETLGRPESEGIVGRNVNDLLIESLVERHLEVMKNTDRFGRLLNAQRDFYIKTFNHEFKSIIFTLRLWPSLEKDLTGIIAIGPNRKHIKTGHCLVLVTPDMNILEAEDNFWVNLADSKGRLSLIKNVLEITEKFRSVKQLLHICANFIEEADKIGVENETDTPLNSIYSLCKQLLKMNEDCTLKYKADECSRFAKVLKDIQIKCKMNVVTVMGVEIHQMHMIFNREEEHHPAIKKFGSILAGTNLETLKELNKKTLNSISERKASGSGESKQSDYFEKALAQPDREQCAASHSDESGLLVDTIILELFALTSSAKDYAAMKMCPLSLRIHVENIGQIVEKTLENMRSSQLLKESGEQHIPMLSLKNQQKVLTLVIPKHRKKETKPHLQISVPHIKESEEESQSLDNMGKSALSLAVMTSGESGKSKSLVPSQLNTSKFVPIEKENKERGEESHALQAMAFNFANNDTETNKLLGKASQSMMADSHNRDLQDSRRRSVQYGQLNTNLISRRSTISRRQHIKAKVT